jgi:crotonobetainyl-CoA:carnitine CoA-transferase CaiB-like acyl-CoA transferase
MSRVLEGVRVLDFGQGVAGPYCAMLLGDHGADVVKVEPRRADWSRTMGAQDGSGFTGTFVAVKPQQARRVPRPRAARGHRRRARARIEGPRGGRSFRPGVMDRLGLGREALRGENANLIYCSVTGFGETGPNAAMPAGDSIMQAYGGLMSIVGERDGDPLRVGNVVSDMIAGANAFSGVLLALLGRERGEPGDGDVRVSLLDSIVAFQGPPLTEYLLTGNAPKRLGNEHPLIAPSGAVRTADGQINYTVFDHQWRAFCANLGLERLAEDPRFAGTGARQVEPRRVETRSCRPCSARAPARSGSRRCAPTTSWCAPIHEYPALVADPQVKHNAILGTVASGERDLPMIRNPVRVGEEAPRLAAPPAPGRAHPRGAGERAGVFPRARRVAHRLPRRPSHPRSRPSAAA